MNYSMTTMNIRKSQKERDGRFYAIAFLLPFLSMLLIFILRGIYPFGNITFLKKDFYQQYTPFFYEFYRKVHSGDSLFYSWNAGLGANFLAIYAYYLSSPLNFLGMLFPEDYIVEFMSYMVVLKIGLCGLTMAHYLKCHFRRCDIAMPFFAMAYAMSGFVAAYNWNVMWMDVLVLSPLIILGLERIMSGKSPALYCICLSAAIFSNYYLCIMLCIYLSLYCAALIIQGKGSISRFLRFLWYSALSGAFGAVLILPEYAAIRFSSFTKPEIPRRLVFYMNPFELIGRHLVAVETETGLDHWPNIYCGLIVLFLVPMYAAIISIPLKERLSKLALALFMLLSFNLDTLNYIWHGLNYPDSLPARQSFLYIILILTMSYEAFLNIKKCSGVTFAASGAVGLILTVLTLIMDKDDAITESTFILSIIFLIVMIFMLTLQRLSVTTRQRRRRAGEPIYMRDGSIVPNHNRVIGYGSASRSSIFSSGFRGDVSPLWLRLIESEAIFTSIALCLFLALEIFLNTYITSSRSIKRSDYFASFSAYRQLNELSRLQNARDANLLARTDELGRKIRNNSMMIDFSSLSCFSSTNNVLIERYCERYGLMHSRVFYLSDGTNPVTAGLLGQHFVLSPLGYDYELEDIARQIDRDGDYLLYECAFSLRGAYALHNIDSALFSAPQENLMDNNAENQVKRTAFGSTLTPFELTNAIARALGGKNAVFKRIGIINLDEKETEFTFPADCHIYAYNTAFTGSDIKLTYSDSENPSTWNTKKYKYIYNLGHHASGVKVTFSLNDKDTRGSEITLYTLDSDALTDLAGVMEGAEKLENMKRTDSSLSGSIDMKSDGQLIVQLPYEEGWSLKVDGREAQIELFDGLYISTPLSKGQHEIEINFIPPLFTQGAAITLISAALTMLSLLLRSRR